MQHQLITIRKNHNGETVVCYLTRDDYRCAMHYAQREEALTMLAGAIDDDGSDLYELNVLSIDAWRDGSDWTWNQWYQRGTITKREFGQLGCTTRAQTRRTLAWFREQGYLSEESKGAVALEDDEYNLVVIARHTCEPLFAIEYGPAY